MIKGVIKERKKERTNEWKVIPLKKEQGIDERRNERWKQKKSWFILCLEVKVSHSLYVYIPPFLCSCLSGAGSHRYVASSIPIW